MQRSRVLGSAVAVLMLAGAGVAATNNRGGNDIADEAGYSTSGSAELVGAPAASGGGTADRATADAPGGVAARAVTPGGPRVVKTASMTVSLAKAASVADAAAQANSIAERHGGFVAGTETTSGEHASSALTLRVPVGAYDAALGDLRRLGKVSDEAIRGEDVTGQLVDLDARLRSLRAQEIALNGLMAKANTVGETLQVAQAVGEVRTQIEQLAGQQKALSDQADFATISLRLVGPGAPVSGEPPADPLLVRALRQASHGTLAVLGGAIVVVGYTLPALLIAAAAYAVLRRRRRIAAVA